MHHDNSKRLKHNVLTYCNASTETEPMNVNTMDNDDLSLPRILLVSHLEQCRHDIQEG